MNKGLTYFRLVSPYEGDITKNCGLDGYEVDSNFFTLEGRDIKSVNVNGNELVITLMNGETISTLNAFSDFTKDITFDFDPTSGVLYIKRNGVTQEIHGFATEYNTSEAVATDGSIKGNGKPFNPIGVSPMAKTGMYRPVKRVVDMTKCECLPEHEKVMPGDRYVTLENISEYGFLYDYEGVKQIACDLVACNSPWRIPTKEDWDDMLNAIEPCDSDKDHASATCNRYFGKFAGKFLKSKDYWKLETPCGSGTCINYGDGCGDFPTCTCGKQNICSPTYCGEYGSCQGKPAFYPNRGIDKYGFGINPAGYADDGCQYGYFLERAWFWTASNKQYTNAYTKRFEFNKSTVYQDVISTKYHLSLRLVKDYTGDNYLERENILGMPYSTVLMPSQKKGKAIWTATNIALPNNCYKPIYPNDGMGVVLTKKYFINEWDGRKWLKNELSEGESVVIEHAPNGNSCIEYRIVNGDLISTSNAIYEQVMTTITPTLDNLQNQINNEVTRAIARENEIEKNLMAETERATNRENELEEMIKSESSAHDSDISEIHNRLDSTDETIKHINDTLSDFGQETAKAFEQINNVIETSVNTINAAIDAERTIRESSDKQLSDLIYGEAANRENADKVLQSNIDAEAEARKEADKVLQANIEAEAYIRAEKDAELKDSIQKNAEFANELSKRLDGEIEARTKADEVLQANIDAVDHELQDLEDKFNNHTDSSDAEILDLKEALKNETEAREKRDIELDAAIKNVDFRVDYTDEKVKEINDTLSNFGKETAKAFEQINEVIATSVNTINGAIAAEKQERQDGDVALQKNIDKVDSQLHVQEGSVFNSETGVLTLKSKGLENDINIQFSLNFGDI